MTVVTRFAAYAAKLPLAIYDKMACWCDMEEMLLEKKAEKDEVIYEKMADWCEIQKEAEKDEESYCKNASIL